VTSARDDAVLQLQMAEATGSSAGTLLYLSLSRFVSVWFLLGPSWFSLISLPRYLSDVRCQARLRSGWWLSLALCATSSYESVPPERLPKQTPWTHAR
jgi:hypothetical protein